MKLTDDIELIDGLPIAYIKSISSIVLSDLHLGYEGMMARRGVLSPKVNLKKIKSAVSAALERTSAEKVIVTGDIKNDFSDVDVEEFNELHEFIEFVKGKGASQLLIKGNHDNFISRYRNAFGVVIKDEYAQVGSYLFFHGDELPKVSKSTRALIMGHEHPAIAVYNEAGRKEKLKCFLYGKYMGLDILILPAICYFSTGTEVNIELKDSLLSPVFSKIDLDSMRAIAIGYGSTEDFGKVGDLRALWGRLSE
ncbi:MAG: metallophosphoesterase [Candidatus Micrarchaeaceae archaeon]